MAPSNHTDDFEKQQANSVAIAACIPLRFLFNNKQRQMSRRQTPELNDSSIFYGLWNLFGLEAPAVRPYLSESECEALDAFSELFHALNWQTLPEQPHLCTLPNDKLLDSIQDSGRALYDILNRRQRIPLWRKIKLKLQGW